MRVLDVGTGSHLSQLSSHREVLPHRARIPLPVSADMSSDLEVALPNTQLLGVYWGPIPLLCNGGATGGSKGKHDPSLNEAILMKQYSKLSFKLTNINVD